VAQRVTITREIIALMIFSGSVRKRLTAATTSDRPHCSTCRDQTKDEEVSIRADCRGRSSRVEGRIKIASKVNAIAKVLFIASIPPPDESKRLLY
jgi:hypothetical protein